MTVGIPSKVIEPIQTGKDPSLSRKENRPNGNGLFRTSPPQWGDFLKLLTFK